MMLIDDTATFQLLAQKWPTDLVPKNGEKYLIVVGRMAGLGIGFN